MDAPFSVAPRHVVAPLKARKHLRMQGWDFTSPGWYFLTICTKNMHAAFGTVVNSHMVLNDAGRIAEKFWREIPQHFPRAVVDEHVVMPNHVHGLLNLTAEGWNINGLTARREAFGRPVAGSVPTIVRSYKAAVSKALGESVWQSRFYEVRARDDAARTNIRNYIRRNPGNYDAVMNGGEPRFLGNKTLLNMPKVGFLASRGQNALHGSLPIKPGEAIMSGFLSPMERAVFRAGLTRKRPMIWVLPAGLNTACREGLACRTAIEDGRLLVLSPFDSALDAPTARRAAWCNQYVLAHCDRAVVGHLNPDGMLACILHEVDPEKKIIRL
jgi:putative transposase